MKTVFDIDSLKYSIKQTNHLLVIYFGKRATLIGLHVFDLIKSVDLKYNFFCHSAKYSILASQIHLCYEALMQGNLLTWCRCFSLKAIQNALIADSVSLE